MIEFKKLPFFQAKEIFTRHHYLHYLSRASIMNYAVYRDNKLIGAVSLNGSPHGKFKEKTLALSRFWLKDNEKNLGSQVLSSLIKFLKKNKPKYKKLISYACSCMHEGTIYKAANFKFVGISKGTLDKRLTWRKTSKIRKSKRTRSPHLLHDKLKFEYDLVKRRAK